MKKRILVTGASGTIGKEVLTQLIENKGFEITVFSKYSSKNVKNYKKYKGEIKIVYGDIVDLGDVKKLTETFETVIHLAAIIPPLADEKWELTQKVNVIGTKNLIAVLESTSPECIFMYSSSIAVYGDRINSPEIKIGDELAPELNTYTQTKVDAEKMIQQSKLDWTIFRLTAIMGVQNHKISKLIFHMPLATKMEIATPGDTARAFVNGIEKRKELSKHIFNLAGGKDCRITYRQLLERSFEIYGLGKLNFPDKTFAEKNFHCGYYMDGDELEEIVRFRQHNLDYYFEMNRKGISNVQRFFTRLFKGPVKFFLRKTSEPLRAYKNGDKELSSHFFTS